MSKRRREAMEAAIQPKLKEISPLIADSSNGKSQWKKLSRGHRWLVLGLIAFVAIGVLGGGLKYLEESARAEQTRRQAKPLTKDLSSLSSLNPFLPMPTPTPQLSKEYIYAGSRLLAVEDGGSNAIPPADLAVWRPSNSTWYVLGGAGSQGFQYAWGASSDKAAPGDYDGDGKTDLCIFRPSNGTWWILRSSDATYYIESIGSAGDEISQGDFDGDGKTDIAVFRPLTGVWYIKHSSTGNLITTSFGTSGDIPAVADYDGDGKHDISIWRNSTASFWGLKSSDGNWLNLALGSTGDNPVPGDYDADGKADFATQSATTWSIKRSSDGVMDNQVWGVAGDIAVQNDYDGDGKVDIATWRPSDGNWRIRQSAYGNTLRQVAWGTNGDIPVASFYRR